MANYYYSGQGTLYFAERDVNGKPKGFISVGNVPELSINIETTKFEHKESETGSRLTDLTIIKEKKGTFSCTLESLNADNLAMALWGTKTAVAGGTVSAGTPESIVIPMGASAGLRFPMAHPTVSSVVVKDPTNVTTYVADTDYSLDAANGVIILKTGAIVTAAVGAATSINVSYTYAAHTQIDGFTSAAAPERWLRFEGINTVDNKRCIIDLFKAQIDPLTDYALINEELGKASLKGSLLADLLIQSGSKFFRQQNVT